MFIVEVRDDNLEVTMGLRQKSSLKPAKQGKNKGLKQKGQTSLSRGRSFLSEVACDPMAGVRKNRRLAVLTEPHREAEHQKQSNGPQSDETLIKVESAVRSLGQLEAEVISSLFPADGSAPASYEEIAERLGMTTEEVKGIADNALRGLRGSCGQSRLSSAWN